MQDQYKYHLKDKEKEKLLSQLCKNQNAFLEALQLEARRIIETNERDIIFVSFGDLPSVDEYTARLTRDDIIQINEYNPKIWNNFLKVVPPENVPLRLEVLRKVEVDRPYSYAVSRYCYCAIWDGRHFFVADINIPAIQIDQDELANKRIEVYFKAWDD